MSDPPRRRIDLTTLPAAVRYGIALAVTAGVVGLVVATRDGDDRTNEPPGWYGVVVRIGAVALLAYGAYRLVRLLRGRTRRD